MAHRNAPLARSVGCGWPAPRRPGLAGRPGRRAVPGRPPDRARWATRYRDRGPAGMADRSSRPHHWPRRTPPPVVRKIVHLRWTQRSAGPDRRPARPGRLDRARGLGPLPASAGSRHLDRATGQPIRRYEHAHPGELIHVDVKKLGNIPAGGGHRFLGRAAGKQATARPTAPAAATSRHRHPLIGTRVHAHRRRRPLPAGLRRDPRRRDQRPPPPGACTEPQRLVRRPRRHHPAGPHRQRQLLPSPPLARRLPPSSASPPRRTRPYRPQTNGKVCEDSCWCCAGPSLTPAKV